MLNVNSLIAKLDALEPIYQKAYENAFKSMFNHKSDQLDEMAKKYAEQMTNSQKAISVALAGAIDYYVRSINFKGTIITVGSPTTQTAKISCVPVNQINGTIPNSIGVY